VRALTIELERGFTELLVLLRDPGTCRCRPSESSLLIPTSAGACEASREKALRGFALERMIREAEQYTRAHGQ